MRIAFILMTALVALAPASGITPVLAQAAERDWVSEKCNRYKEAFAAAMTRVDAKAISPAFLEAHQLFIDSNCTARADVCPKAPEEFRLANMLVLMGMNAGMSATFFPFACRKPGA